MTNNTPKMPNGISLGLVGLSSTYKPGTLIPRHAHTAHQIVHAISGTMRVKVQDLMWFLPPGRAMWIPSRTDHSIDCVGQVEMRTAYLSEAYPVIATEVVVIAVSPLMREVLVRLADSDFDDQQLLLADVLMNEFQQGTLQRLSLPIPKDPRVEQLVLHWQEYPGDQKTLETWAKRLGFSERNLIRIIRAETGMTFRELRRFSRIMVSLDCLSAGQSVTEAAFSVGFETPSAFIHAFRMLLGKTPRKFISGRKG
jgi:AraC-like DNA-binding protein